MHSRDLHGVTFHFNADYSGSVIVQVGERETLVPMASLVAFVASFVRDTMHSRLDSMRDTALLQLLPRLPAPDPSDAVRAALKRADEAERALARFRQEVIVQNLSHALLSARTERAEKAERECAELRAEIERCRAGIEST